MGTCRSRYGRHLSLLQYPLPSQWQWLMFSTVMLYVCQLRGDCELVQCCISAVWRLWAGAMNGQTALHETPNSLPWLPPVDFWHGLSYQCLWKNGTVHLTLPKPAHHPYIKSLASKAGSTIQKFKWKATEILSLKKKQENEGHTAAGTWNCGHRHRKWRFVLPNSNFILGGKCNQGHWWQ